VPLSGCTALVAAFGLMPSYMPVPDAGHHAGGMCVHSYSVVALWADGCVTAGGRLLLLQSCRVLSSGIYRKQHMLGRRGDVICCWQQQGTPDQKKVHTQF
jgi:hypothetical protein